MYKFFILVLYTCTLVCAHFSLINLSNLMDLKQISYFLSIFLGHKNKCIPDSSHENKRPPHIIQHEEHVTHLTQLSNKVRWAFTHEAVQHCTAVGTVLAWTAVTFIPLHFTVSADKSWRTLAVVTFCALLNNTQREINSKITDIHKYI